MRFALFVIPLLISTAVVAAPAPATRPAVPAYAPTSSYEKRDVDGWTVYVARDLRDAAPDLAAKAVELLRSKLLDLRRALPAKAIDALRPVPIWIERDDPRFPGMCYHPSVDWLRANGFNPDKARAVEIGNARHFLTWSLDQPSMVLHEFAHAYHDLVLGYDNPVVRQAFEHARDQHLYDSVLRASGRTERAYALTNDQEFFAESSEAFFGTNDFYPFVRAELEQHDPVTAAALRTLWDLPSRPAVPATTEPDAPAGTSRSRSRRSRS